MLNWAGLSSLLIIVAGPFSGLGAAHAHKAGAMSLALFATFGLIIGIGLAVASSKLAYAVLRSKRFTDWMKFYAYMSIPFVSLVAVIFVPFLLAEIIL